MIENYTSIPKRVLDFVWAHIKRIWFQFVFALPFILLALGIVCIIVFSIQIQRIRSVQFDQMADLRWGQDSVHDYRQVSVIGRGSISDSDGMPLYIDSRRSLNVSEIDAIREELNMMILSADRGGGRAPNRETTVRRWVDTYSTTFRTSLSPIVEGEVLNQKSDAWLVGVSGHYTLFHPMEYVSGSFLALEPVQKDTIVINDQLAWNLFFSYDVLDQSIEINGRNYTIVGVVREGRHSAHEAANAGSPRAYIYFEELVHFVQTAPIDDFFSDFNEGLDSQTADANISVDQIAVMIYEAVLPDPIRNIAINDLKMSVKSYDENTNNFVFINNSDRFTLFRLINDYFPLEDQIVNRNGFDYPYWELSAQIAENQLRICWVIIGAGSIIVAISSLCVYYNLKRRLGVKRV